MSFDLNPYATGRAFAQLQQVPGEPASATRRFWTFVADTIAIRIGFLILEIAYGVWYGVAALEELNGLKWWGSYMAFYGIYYVALEVLFGRTLGKVLTGTRVVTSEGRALSMPTALLRTLCRLLPLEPMSFSLGETWWHDHSVGRR
ncbi:RDD family protein [Massilia sp. SR12]